MRFCPNCGTPITPGQQVCLSCGKPLPIDKKVQPISDPHAETMLSSFPQSKTPPISQSNNANYPPAPGEYTPTTVSNPPFIGYPPPPNSGIYSGSPSGSGSSLPPVTFSAPDTYYRQMQPPPPPPASGIMGQPPTWTPPPTPGIMGQTSAWTLPPVQQKRKPSKKVFFTLAFVTMLIMGTGFWLIYYTTISHPAQLRIQATATIQARSTAETNMTGTAVAQTTGTAIAQAHAAATAQTQETAQAQATATTFQNLYTKSTSGTPNLSSSLNSQDGANWDLYDAVGGGGCTFTNGSLHASVMQKNYYVPCFALNSNYNNMAYQAEMTIVTGTEGGLIFRGNQTSSQFYLFRVGQDGSYSLYVSKDDKSSTAIVDDTTTAIKKGTGQTNLITVIAQGSNIYLYINKQYVGSVNDPSYTGGKIGIFGSNSANNTDVAFNNVQVWPL